MDAAALKLPMAQRFNLRMVVFWIVMLALVGYPIYLYLDTSLSGGIRQRGEYTQIDLKAMSSFPCDQRAGTIDDVPEIWRKQDGKKVTLYGAMWQTQATTWKRKAFQALSACAEHLTS